MGRGKRGGEREVAWEARWEDSSGRGWEGFAEQGGFAESLVGGFAVQGGFTESLGDLRYDSKARYDSKMVSSSSYPGAQQQRNLRTRVPVLVI